MPTSDWTPQVPDIGGVLRARTKDTNGVEVGTFNAGTRPTGEQVTLLIQQGVADVSLVTGDDVPQKLWRDARYVASLQTAMLVELSFFPEQLNSNRSPYNQLERMYNDKLKRLLTAIESARSGGDGGGDPLKPVGGFPIFGDPYIIGRATQW